MPWPTPTERRNSRTESNNHYRNAVLYERPQGPTGRRNQVPKKQVAIVLSGPNGEIGRGTTNADGRCPELAPAGLAPGRYALRFAVADYFRGLGVTLTEPPFLDEVVVDFGVAADGGHYHVPLLVSPYAYSTYRGS